MASQEKIVIQPGAVIMFRPEFMERLKIENVLGAESAQTQQILADGFQFLADIGRLEKTEETEEKEEKK